MNSFTKSLYMSCFISSVFAANTMEIHPSVLRQNTLVTTYPSPVEDFKSGDVVVYRNSRISDVEGASSFSVLSVLSNIKHAVLESPYNPTNLTVDLSENYITSAGFKKLVDFLISERQIASRIKHLDLSNNRIDCHARDDILRLLRMISQLTLDLSINYLAPSELGEIEESEKKRITIRTY